jgi:hypothetical protein
LSKSDNWVAIKDSWNSVGKEHGSNIGQVGFQKVMIPQLGDVAVIQSIVGHEMGTFVFTMVINGLAINNALCIQVQDMKIPPFLSAFRHY